jgi:DNA mismatch repair protein MutS2
MEQRERDLERDGRGQARSYLLDARRRVEEALGIARSAATQKAAKEARRLVEEGVRQEGDALKRLEDKAQAKGWRVKRRGAGSGELGAEPEQRGAERGAKGASSTGPADVSVSGRIRSAPRSQVPAPDLDSAASEIDIRGLTGDEAESTLVLALDAAVAADLPWLRIIHGKGTGVLRVRVGQVLQRDRRVARFQLAPPEQGGTGVTVVELGS